jgi:hypothetical protein
MDTRIRSALRTTAHADLHARHAPIARERHVRPRAPSQHDSAQQDYLAGLIALLRERAAPPIEFGRARYDGCIYAIVAGTPARIDRDEILRRLADRLGTSRFGTRGQDTWYGALDADSAMAEAAYSALTHPTRRRTTNATLIELRVHGRFADLHGRQRQAPQILADTYAATQELAARVRHVSGLHGVLYPSSRSNGICLALFDEHAIRDARAVGTISMCRIGDDAVRVYQTWDDTCRVLRVQELRRTT